MSLYRILVTPRVVLFLLFTALVIWTESAVTHTVVFTQHVTSLSLAVFADLVVVTTGVFYWLVARPLRLAGNRTLLVALLMMRIAFFVLPPSAFTTGQSWTALLALAEGAVLLIAGFRIRVLMQTYQRLRLTTDAETAFQESLARVFGYRLASLMTSEGIVFYYAILGWRLQADLPSNAQPVTTYRQSGQIALTVALLVVGLIEGVGVHLLLTRWNPVVAVGISGLSAYGMLFFIADITATLKRPSYLMPGCLNLRLGIRWRASIASSAIASVSLINEKPAKQAGRLNGAFLTAPNVLLSFAETVCIAGPYGIRKEIRQLAFFVDDRSAFLQSLRAEKSD